MKNEFEKMQDRAAKKALKYQQMKDYVWSGNRVSKDVYAGMTKEERGQYNLYELSDNMGRYAEKHPIKGLLLIIVFGCPLLIEIIIALILSEILH